MAGDVRQLRVVITAEDYDGAVVFYREVLGLPEEAAGRRAHRPREPGAGLVRRDGRVLRGAPGIRVRLTSDLPS